MGLYPPYSTVYTPHLASPPWTERGLHVVLSGIWGVGAAALQLLLRGDLPISFPLISLCEPPAPPLVFFSLRLHLMPSPDEHTGGDVSTPKGCRSPSWYPIGSRESHGEMIQLQGGGDGSPTDCKSWGYFQTFGRDDSALRVLGCQSGLCSGMGGSIWVGFHVPAGGEPVIFWGTMDAAHFCGFLLMAMPNWPLAGGGALRMLVRALAGGRGVANLFDSQPLHFVRFF